MKNSNSHSFYFWFSKKLATFWKLKNELFFYLALALNLFSIFEKTRNFWKLKKIKKILTRTRASLDFKFFMKLKLTLNLISNLKKTRDSHSLKNSSKKLTRTQKSKKNWEKLVYLAWKWPFLSKKHEKSRDSGSKIAIWAEKTWKNSSFSSLLALFSKIFSTQTRTLFIFDFWKNSQLFENWKMSYFFNSHSHSNPISIFWKTRTRTQIIFDFRKNS